MAQHQKLQDPKGRVLVVDDDPAVMALRADFLEQQGFKVRTAHNGPTALAAFNVEHFDVILLMCRCPA